MTTDYTMERQAIRNLAADLMQKGTAPEQVGLGLVHEGAGLLYMGIGKVEAVKTLRHLADILEAEAEVLETNARFN
ncbi:hypothetical protein [Rhodospirillaceae bacterium SYSU D60014]|uniref:hypothetical protein n=1 Tax=Virgifigura deserti TaxID=2268457 RepID=UPI000E672B46